MQPFRKFGTAAYLLQQNGERVLLERCSKWAVSCQAVIGQYRKMLSLDAIAIG